MTAEEVRALQVGESVELIGSGQSVTCTVASSGGAKFLTWRDKGQIKRFAIREYAGRTYIKSAASPRAHGKTAKEKKTMAIIAGKARNCQTELI